MTKGVLLIIKALLYFLLIAVGIKHFGGVQKLIDVLLYYMVFDRVNKYFCEWKEEFNV